MNACVLQGIVARIVRWSVSAAFIALVFGVAGVSRAQTNDAKAPARKAAAAASPVESAAKGMNTGITVHGHWVINVLTPSGKLVSHTEFENSLQLRGKSILALVLGQQQTMGPWEISLAGAGPCTNLTSPPNGGSCIIDQSGTGLAAFDCAGTVSGLCSTNMPAPVVSAGTLQLSGSLTFPATPSTGGNITSVETVETSCANNVSPPACLALSPTANGGGGAWVFTVATLGTAGEPPVVPVGAGQIVQVTVTFTFS